MKPWWLLTVLCVAAGCGADGSIIIDPCGTPPESASDPPAASVLAIVTGHHDLDGTWLNSGAAAVLSIDMDVGSPLPGSTTGCGGSLLLGATVNVKTRDGVLSGLGTVVRFDTPWRATVEIPRPALPDAYAHPDPALPPLRGVTVGDHPVERVSSTAPTLVLTITTDGLLAELIVDQQRLVGQWSSDAVGAPFRRAPAYVVPPELVADCAPAADYTGAGDQRTTFASGADATAATIGTWIRCRSWGVPEDAGIQISPDGSWRMLAWQDGAFVTRGGIQREGALEPPIDVGAGQFQVDLRGPGVGRSSWVWENRLIMPDFAAPPDFGVSIYVRTDRVVASGPNPYAPGERGGTAACAIAESGTIDPDLGDPLASTLAGRWTLCSGELLAGYGGLTFDGRGVVTFLDADGQPMGGSAYQAMHFETIPVESPRPLAFLFPDMRDWRVIFSERPLKLWLVESGPHTTDRVALFSALP